MVKDLFDDSTKYFTNKNGDQSNFGKRGWHLERIHERINNLVGVDRICFARIRIARNVQRNRDRTSGIRSPVQQHLLQLFNNFLQSHPPHCYAIQSLGQSNHLHQLLGNALPQYMVRTRLFSGFFSILILSPRTVVIASQIFCRYIPLF